MSSLGGAVAHRALVVALAGLDRGDSHSQADVSWELPERLRVARAEAGHVADHRSFMRCLVASLSPCHISPGQEGDARCRGRRCGPS